jgi:hypothetical protein
MNENDVINEERALWPQIEDLTLDCGITMIADGVEFSLYGHGHAMTFPHNLEGMTHAVEWIKENFQ